MRSAADDVSVITYANDAFVPGLELLHESLRPSGLRLTCSDAGLSTENRQRLSDHGIEVKGPPCRFPNRDELWLAKPYMLRENAPTNRIIWLDSDTVVLGDLSPFLKMLEHGPVFTWDYCGQRQSRNKPNLYALLPAMWDGSVLNSGVFALDLARDRAVMDHWIYCIDMMKSRPEVRAAVKHTDQGALLWAVEKLRITHRITKERRWNWPARRKIQWDASRLLEQAREVHPEASILHWMGAGKWWQGPNHSNDAIFAGFISEST